jgi:hypothetical protein
MCSFNQKRMNIPRSNPVAENAQGIPEWWFLKSVLPFIRP